MSLIQLLKLKTWETRLLKMPHFEMPHFQTGTRVTVASVRKSFKDLTRKWLEPAKKREKEIRKTTQFVKEEAQWYIYPPWRNESKKCTIDGKIKGISYNSTGLLGQKYSAKKDSITEHLFRHNLVFNASFPVLDKIFFNKIEFLPDKWFLLMDKISVSQFH